jgi:flagellin-like hook-associated protein FlgL
MTISSIGSKASPSVQSLVDLRSQLDNLQQQLATGKKSTTYAGLGLGRGVTVSLNAQLSAISSFDQTIGNVSTRISVAQLSLGNMFDIGNSLKTTMAQGSSGGGTLGATAVQQSANMSLDEMIGDLNSQAGAGYLFSGRDTDKAPVETYDHILNGNGSQAGLKQIISERNQADLGANGLGRLTLSSPSAGTATLTEDATTFGMKISSVTSTLSNATVTGPAGSPAAMSVDFTGGNPNPGDTITMRFTMPDGSTENMTLTATTANPPGANAFTIGVNASDTAANFQSGMTSALGTLAATSLTAASAVQASNEFFDADVNNPPLRVDGPPFDSATGLVPGTSANSVIWYQGETGTDPARSSASARIDPSLTVNYGVRANEQGIRSLLQGVATMAAVTVPDDANTTALSSAFNQRVAPSLNGTAGGQTISNIQTDLANAQVSLNNATQRHAQQSSTLSTYLDQIQGVSNEEVGAQILTLQTRLQASMQVTAMIYQTSLVNYMK